MVRDLLRLYEDEILVPLVEEAGLEAVRDRDVDVSFCPGTTVAFINNAERFYYVNDLVHWNPLSVVYSDPHGAVGTVFSLESTFDPKVETVSFQKAEITGIVTLVRHGGDVVWRDPLSGQTMLQFSMQEADKVLMNSWYVFRGGVLPMLRDETFRFVEPHEERAFQAMMIRRIHQIYEGLV